MITPFIRPIRVQGGTFYTFPSASEDITYTHLNADTKFTFSKFVLLNIPEIRQPDQGQNWMQLDAIPGAYHSVDSTDWNKHFAESFQNYCLNLEKTITSSSDYVSDSLQTISERVFFKWLKSVGALRFKEADPEEVSSLATGKRFTEEGNSSAYSRVVQYIGDISITNNARLAGNTQTDIICYIPTESGNTPYTLFKSIEDENYYYNRSFLHLPEDPLDAEYLLGRDSNDVHPAGLSTLAFFDSDVAAYDGNGQYILEKKNDDSTYTVGWWFQNPAANAYYLEPSTLEDPRNDIFRITGVGSKTDQVEFTRSRLDGISLDFDITSYKQATENSGIFSWRDFNVSDNSSNYEFNTVLIYYDVYSTTDSTKRSTNLYGVLFLDNLTLTSQGGGKIPTYSKQKPNRSTGLNGNSYGFKINITLDTNAQDASVVNSINEYNTFSMQLYSDALTLLKEYTGSLATGVASLNLLNTRVSDLEDTYTSLSTATDIYERLDAIEASLSASQSYFANSKSLVDLINRNYMEILNIYQNKTSIEVAYNLDALYPGEGILLDRSIPGKLKVVNDREGMSININKPRISIFSDFEQTLQYYKYYYELLPGNNYICMFDEINTQYSTDRDVHIYINDTLNPWKTGQTCRISFKTPVLLSNNFGAFKFKIFTDASNITKNPIPYTIQIAELSYSDFVNSQNAPLFEIICLDSDNLDFEIEEVR